MAVKALSDAVEPRWLRLAQLLAFGRRLRLLFLSAALFDRVDEFFAKLVLIAADLQDDFIFYRATAS